MDRIEKKWMERALVLAARGAGGVEPNPMVGCVIVRAGRVVAEGWHKKFGGPHAEVVALRQAARRGVSVRGCDVYVSLEPCCHHGKTPPCTDALIAARPARVVVAMRDPFEKVRGGGVAALEGAGVRVEVGLCGAEAMALNAPFVRRVTRGLPWVIAKWAQTEDGYLTLPAARKGKPAWITGDASRAHAHALRARVDAVVAGVGTIVADDARLTARGVRVRRTACRVVIDPRLRVPIKARVLDTAEAPTMVVVSEATLQRAGAKARRLMAMGVEIVPMHEKRGGLDLAALMRYLVTTRGMTNVMVEGGAKTLQTFFDAGLVCERWTYTAPVAVGGVKKKLARVPMVKKKWSGRLVETRGLSRERLGGVDVFCRYRAGVEMR